MIPPADDLDRIMSVMIAAFDPAYGEAWTRRQVEDALLIGNCHYHIIDEDGLCSNDSPSATGFFLSRTGYEEEELLLFAVHPNFRRKGFGSALLRELARAARNRGAQRLLLEMRHNNPAESLYRAFGFEPIGRRPGYYRTRNGERLDAITFACPIKR